MEIVTRGCTLPIDVIVGDSCIGGSLLFSAIAAVVFGVIVGLLRFGGNIVANFVDSYQKIEPDQEVDEIGRALRCLVAMAAADGYLDDNEVFVIRWVAAHCFGYDFSEDMIRETFRRMGARIDVEAEINGTLGGGKLRDKDAIEALFHGVILVAACDGEVSKPERNLLQNVATSFGLNRETIRQMIGKAELEAVEWARVMTAEKATQSFPRRPSPSHLSQSHKS